MYVECPAVHKGRREGRALFLSAVLTPDQLLPCPTEAIADPYQTISCNVLLCNITKSLKEAIADHIWVHQPYQKEQDMVCSDILDNMVYIVWLTIAMVQSFVYSQQ